MRDTVQVQDSAAPTTTPAARPGAVILVRHGEPALSRRCKLTSDEYRAWWARYEVGGLLGGQTAPVALQDLAKTSLVLHSPRPRAIETARAIAGELDMTLDETFVEAPLPPPRFPSWMRFSPRTWGVIARFWWWAFDHHQGEETRDQAKARARKAADLLEGHTASGRNVMVLAHGFFNGMVGMELTRRGWRCVEDQGFQYWCARRFERR